MQPIRRGKVKNLSVDIFVLASYVVMGKLGKKVFMGGSINISADFLACPLHYLFRGSGVLLIKSDRAFMRI